VCSSPERGHLNLEQLAGVEPYGRKVSGDFEADYAMQAAPDQDGAQGDGRVDVGVVRLGPGCQLRCQRRRNVGAVPDRAENVE
jgi:hypothetical protein